MHRQHPFVLWLTRHWFSSGLFAGESGNLVVRVRRLRPSSQSLEQPDRPVSFAFAIEILAASVSTTAPVARTHLACLMPTQPSTVHDDAPMLNSTSAVIEEPSSIKTNDTTSSSKMNKTLPGEPAGAAPFPNGYHFPPKHTFVQSTSLGLRASWRYFLTPLGFCVIIYGLNVVAWGGMLFLLLCNASPAMCHPTCNHIDSPRRKWIEWDSQILNALFCVTGFGLAPWRFRDLYFLLKYRVKGDTVALRRLAGIHRGWFRLPGSPKLPSDVGPHNVADSLGSTPPSAIPYPDAKIPDAPLTGQRAPETTLWKMDAVIWLMVWNTFLQCCLAGFMWGLNRYDRPSWSTGLFVALACIVAAVGGIMMVIEGKRVKSIEGVPVSPEDLQRLKADREQGIWHYNNIKGKKLKEDGGEKAQR
ncbi:hypothetical protein EDB81DRAFT_846534 [Dactylonectria macrodidyma]|uniref:Uncharacterized protein n=1 Tax=Dactylonectria macrodidyma TaxID=307937 RepID=A0A9P9DYG5_9HYPO|nr:hypothetical protein EDB81DRAFT_846534 [Dactylonectria macrodidyma]